MSNTLKMTDCSGFRQVPKGGVPAAATLPWIIHATNQGASQILPGDRIIIIPDGTKPTVASVWVLDPANVRGPLRIDVNLDSSGEHLVSDYMPADANGNAWKYYFYMNLDTAGGDTDGGGSTTRIIFCFDTEAITEKPQKMQHDAGSSDPGYIRR